MNHCQAAPTLLKNEVEPIAMSIKTLPLKRFFAFANVHLRFLISITI